MGEQAPNPETQPEQAPRVPAPKELRQGFELKTDEVVAFDMPSSGNLRRRGWNVGNGITVEGAGVAEIIVGAQKLDARITLVNTNSTADRTEGVLIMTSDVEWLRDKPKVMKLKQGEMWGIGRMFEGQEDLPKTVSKNHCAIGLDENGRIVVENHRPTNITWVRAFV